MRFVQPPISPLRVVSDSGPFIALNAIGRLDLLPQLFDEVTVPRAVALRQRGEDDGLTALTWSSTISRWHHVTAFFLSSERLKSPPLFPKKPSRSPVRVASGFHLKRQTFDTPAPTPKAHPQGATLPSQVRGDTLSGRSVSDRIAG